MAFSGLTLETGGAAPVEGAVGFKGITVEGYRAAYLEPALGFKGMSLEMEPGGFATRINHY